MSRNSISLKASKREQKGKFRQNACTFIYLLTMKTLRKYSGQILYMTMGCRQEHRGQILIMGEQLNNKDQGLQLLMYPCSLLKLQFIRLNLYFFLFYLLYTSHSLSFSLCMRPPPPRFICSCYYTLLPSIFLFLLFLFFPHPTISSKTAV